MTDAAAHDRVAGKVCPLVVGLGEALWDLLPEGAQLGGAPANFAYHAAALGARAVVASAVGDDDRGRELVARLRAAGGALAERGGGGQGRLGGTPRSNASAGGSSEPGLDVSYLAVDPAHPTGTVTVALDGEGKPHYTIHEGVAWDYIPASDALMALAARADAVCFGSLAQRLPVSRATIERFLDATPRECLLVFDINLRQHYYSEDVLRESLARANVLKINDEELPVLARVLGLPVPGRVSAPRVCLENVAQSPSAVNPRVCLENVAQSPSAVNPPTLDLPNSGAFTAEDSGATSDGPFLAHELTGATEADLVENLCGRFGLRAVALTRGARGCLLQVGGTRVEQPGIVPERIADTVGAGDAFTAALVMGLLAGRDAEAIASHANLLASYVCSQRGAMPPVPEELRRPALPRELPEV